MSPLFPVEPKLEVLEDRVVIAVENSNGLRVFDAFNEEETVRRRGRRKFNDEELASSSGLPFSAHDIVEMSTIDFKQLLKTNSLSESQLDIMRNIRRRGQHRASTSSLRQRRKDEGVMRKFGETMNFLMEPKEEPLDNFDSYPTDAEIFSHDGVAMKSEENDMSPLIPVEPKLEVLEDRVVIAVENPNGSKFFDDFNDEARCNVRQFSPNKVDNVRDPKSLKCILCEKYPSTAFAYIEHLSSRHKSTPKANGISLLCSCGVQVNSSRRKDHRRGCDGQEFTIQKRGSIEKSPDTPKCILCEKYPSTVTAYITHLSEFHGSTLIKNGIFLRCLCGTEVFSQNIDPSHRKKCKSKKFDLLKCKLPKKYFETPQCVLCETHPSSMYKYTSHLSQHHNSYLSTNGVFLRCSCGREVYSIDQDPVQNKKCNNHAFTLHKLDSNLKTIDNPKCVLCENGIFLRCTCGSEVYSNYCDAAHSKCAGIEFTLHKLESVRKLTLQCHSAGRDPFHSKEYAGVKFSVWKLKMPQTPPCILCEKYLSTAYLYAHHLANEHKTSLNVNAIYLRCSCGHQIRSSHRSMFHSVKCDARQFTIQKDLPMNYDHCYCLPSRYALYQDEM